MFAWERKFYLWVTYDLLINKLSNQQVNIICNLIISNLSFTYW